MTAPDLSTRQPRPMDATLGGYPWLPRMSDKARAARAGTLGDYYRYPCPIDRECLQRLGLDADTFADIAERATTDEDMLTGLQRAGARGPVEAAFDPIRLNAELHSGAS